MTALRMVHKVTTRAAIWRIKNEYFRPSEDGADNFTGETIACQRTWQNPYAALCSPRRKFWTRYSDVRNEKVKMLIVVVLSVQFRKTLASQTYRFGTSWVWPKRLVTKCFGSLPMRQVPVSCRLKPGISGVSPVPSSTPPAARSTSAQACFECSHIFRTFSSH